MKSTPTFLLCAWIAGVATTVAAQAPPFGAEFQVNTYTTNDQKFPAVASPGDGTFIVVWESDGQDGSRFGIFGQRFDRSGAKSGSEFQVNTYTTGSQGNPEIACAPNGDFVVVWQTLVFPADGSPNDHIFAQRFHINPISKAVERTGSEFQVNAGTTDEQIAASVAMDPAGDFVVVWENSAAAAYQNRGQRFDGSGAKVGPELSISAVTSFSLGRPRVAMDGVGDFVVVWDAYVSASGSEIVGQRFAASGTKIGAAFPVNTHTTGSQQHPSIATDVRGNYVVVWESNAEDGSSTGVFGQRFNSSGEKVGSEFQINTYTTDEQREPTIALDSRGNALVAWESVGQDGSQSGVFGQKLDRHGAAVGPEFPINTYTNLSQGGPRAANDGLGFVVVWESYFQDGFGLGVFGRRDALHPAALAVDAAATSETSSDGNGVLEPGETVLVEPSWSNEGTAADALTGSTPPTFCLVTFPCVASADLSADYGTVLPGFLANCEDGTATPCYTVSATALRPGTHWDSGFAENLSVGGGHLWTLHVGDSFSDVPRSEPFYKKIETLLHNGITSGCTTTTYCPTVPVPRDQMAIFIAKGIAGLGEYVPTTGSVSGTAYNCSPGGHSLFADVAPTDSACKHVHYLAAQNVTLGCNASLYCPQAIVTRDAMASFIAKATVAPGGGAAVPQTFSDSTTGRSYSCDPSSPNIHFTDVPVSQPFCKHIHFLWARGIVDGCSATQYCPAGTVARDAMAKFIANGFNLQLYGP